MKGPRTQHGTLVRSASPAGARGAVCASRSAVCGLRVLRPWAWRADSRLRPRRGDAGARRRARRGVLLVMVLIVITLLSLAGYTFCQLMQSEREAVELTCRQAQARALAESGVEAARIFLAETDDVQKEAGGNYDNAGRFRSALVIDDAQAHDRGRFTLVVSQGDTSSGAAMQSGVTSSFRYGLEDQSTKLNLNALPLYEKYASGTGRKMLMGLPGMTENIADAIMDWIDSDSTARENGAESEYYSTLNPPYAPRNGPLASIEELLLVKGVTPALLFGVDANRNGFADRGESDPLAMENVDNSDRSMDRGWSAYITLWGMERNVQSDGTAKVNINQSDMKKLYDQVKDAKDEDWAKFIVAYRQQTTIATGNANTLLASIQVTPSTSSNTQHTLKSIIELVGAKANVPRTGQGSQSSIVASPISTPTDASIGDLDDKLTVYPSSTIPGRININAASRIVLMMIPGMTDQIADAIIAKRIPDPAQADGTRTSRTWIMSEGIVTLEEMKALDPYVDIGGDVYRVESVGFYESGGPVARVEAVLDATARPPAVLFWRDISHLGRGFPADVLGMESL